MTIAYSSLCSRLKTMFTWYMTVLLGMAIGASSSTAHERNKIVLIAGEVTKIDKVGHHDYTGGCKCLEQILNEQTKIPCVTVENGWPTRDKVFHDAAAVVFYTDGGGKQAFLQSPERIALLNRLAEARVGLVMLHQAVDFPLDKEADGKRWLGGVYATGKSGRGHWDSSHVDFPVHATTRGVTPWKINDGWLNKIQFVDGMKGITPLVWSGKEYAGSRAGLDQDIVGWAYDRPDGGRSFSFTGLDAHAAWKEAGMRQLVVNGIVWSAGLDIPTSGVACELSETHIDSLLTPREAKPAKKAAKKE